VQAFIAYFVSEFHFTPTDNFAGLVFAMVINGVVRLTALSGVIYLGVRTFLTATSHGGF